MNTIDPRYGRRTGLGVLMLALLCSAGQAAAAEEILGRYEARVGAPTAGLVLQLSQDVLGNALCHSAGSYIGGGLAGCRAMGAASVRFSPTSSTPGQPLFGQRFISGMVGLENHPYMRFSTTPKVLNVYGNKGQILRLSVSLISVGLSYSTGGGVGMWARESNSGGCRTRQIGEFEGSAPPGWSNFLSHATGDGLIICRAGELIYLGGQPVEPGRVYDTFVSLQSLSFRVQVLDGAAVPNGQYNGRLDVRVGPFGDVDVQTDGEAVMQIPFRIEVANEMVVHFPDGSTSSPAALTPEGGWLLNPTPTSLRRDLPLVFGTTLPMSIQLRCQHYAGDRCAITRRDGGGVPVPVDIAASLPGYQLRGSGAPVRRSAIPSDRSPGPALELESQSSTPPLSAGAHLRVSTDAAATAQMLTTPGAYYEGNATVMFEVLP